MAPALELAAKTLRLEEIDQPIDAEMAAQLLPLWQLMDELSTNGSTAPDVRGAQRLSGFRRSFSAP